MRSPISRKTLEALKTALVSAPQREDFLNYIENFSSWRKAVQAVNSVSTSLPSGSSLTVDSLVMANGDRVLFTALSQAALNNRVYVVSGIGAAVKMLLQEEGRTGTGSPSVGDCLPVSGGTNYANQVLMFTVDGEWGNVAAVATAPHNSTTGLQGGSSGERYHLTSAQQSGLTGSADTSLHRHDDRYFTEAEVTTALSGKSDTSHNHNSSYYTEAEIDTAVGLLIPITQKASANGVATLGADSKIPTSQLPALAITDTFVVVSQAAMLLLSTAEKGDVAVRTDLNKCFILTVDGYGTLGNWQELLTPTDAVLSVNGATGAVTLTTANISEVTNLYFTNARAIAATLTGYSSGSGTVAAADTILQAINKLNGNAALKAPLDSPVFTGAVTAQSFSGTSLTASIPVVSDADKKLVSMSYATMLTNLAALPLAGGTLTGNLQLSAAQAFIDVPATMSPAGTTQTIDWNLGNYQILDLGSASGNVTLTFSNVKAGASYVLEIIQAATPRTLVWPAAMTMTWSGGAAITLTTTNDAVDIVSLIAKTATLLRASSNKGFA